MNMPVCVLVAGIPASGKTRFAEYASRVLRLPLICKDSVKEKLWERLRYSTSQRAETQKHGVLAYDISYFFAEELMKAGCSFIFESNFTPASADILVPLLGKYGYRAITVLFDADMDVLHDRFVRRDDTDERNPGLRAGGFFDYETFKAATESLRLFQVGEKCVVVDTTDFTTVSYEGILKEINEFIEASETHGGGTEAADTDIRSVSNIYELPELPLHEELTTILANAKNTRIERIVSVGQTSGWYDQDEAEYVVLLQGEARLEFSDEGEKRLTRGDTVYIMPHEKHRVSYTSANPPCIWLCVFMER